VKIAKTHAFQTDRFSRPQRPGHVASQRDDGAIAGVRLGHELGVDRQSQFMRSKRQSRNLRRTLEIAGHASIWASSTLLRDGPASWVKAIA
jgi:hypothetical protein